MSTCVWCVYCWRGPGGDLKLCAGRRGAGTLLLGNMLSRISRPCAVSGLVKATSTVETYGNTIPMPIMIMNMVNPRLALLPAVGDRSPYPTV